jgi:hypothetical protein
MSDKPQMKLLRFGKMTQLTQVYISNRFPNDREPGL